MPPENLPNRQSTSYSFRRQTSHVTGLMQVPAAGPAGTPCIFVRAHAPYEVEIVTWTAESEGGAPIVPSPLSAATAVGLNENRILLDMQIGGVVPIPKGGNAGHIWAMSGVYRYGKIQPEGPIGDLKLGKLPYEKHAVSDNYFAKENFSLDIIDPKPPAPDYPIIPLQAPIQGP